MCRMYGFRANEQTKVECTLVHAQNALLLQSQSDESGRAHADGWGIAFYHDEIPDLERRSTAAFLNTHFSTTAERIYAHAVIAHVRLATIGAPDVVNAHPFVFGQWSFAHNGTVTAFDALESEMFAEVDPIFRSNRLGRTDSELLFLWLLSRIRETGINLNGTPSADEIADIIAPAINNLADRCESAGASEPAKLNTVLTNGHIMLATRWNNDLHVVFRRGVRDCEICGIPHIHHDNAIDYRAVVIASEPISHESWNEVPNHSVVTVSEDIDLTIQPVRRTPARASKTESRPIRESLP